MLENNKFKLLMTDKLLIDYIMIGFCFIIDSSPTPFIIITIAETGELTAAKGFFAAEGLSLSFIRGSQ